MMETLFSWQVRLIYPQSTTSLLIALSLSSGVQHVSRDCIDVVYPTLIFFGLRAMRFAGITFSYTAVAILLNYSGWQSSLLEAK